MPKFKVLRRVDAYLDSVAVVEADDAEEAALLAESNEGDYEWEELGPVGFDARGFSRSMRTTTRSIARGRATSAEAPLRADV